MNLTGICIGIISFLVIGIFHPLVIWGEYYFSKKIWVVFAIVGGIFTVLSVAAQALFASCLFAVIAASCFWSIHELFEQEKRVERGWFPRNPKRRIPDRESAEEK